MSLFNIFNGTAGNGLLEENSRLKEQIHAQASQIAGLEQYLTSLESDIEENVEENGRLKEQIERMDKQIQTYKDGIDDKASEISDLEQCLTSLESDIENRDERIASLTKTMEEERGRAKDEAEKAEEKLKETVDKMKEKMERLVSESRRKEEQMAELNQRLKDLEESYDLKDESKGALDSMTAERDKLQNLLDDAHNDISQKLKTILSLTLSLQRSESDMEIQRETLIGQSSEMRETVKKEVEQAEDKDDKFSDAVDHFQTANSTREKALGDFERKDEEIDHLRSSLGASHSELNVRDTSFTTLQQEFNSLSSNLELLRHQNGSLEETVRVKTAEVKKITGLLVRAEKKAADNLQNAQWEIKRRFSQVTALRRDLARSRLKGKSLKSRLKIAEDEQRSREKRLQTSVALQTELGVCLNEQSEHTKALERELTDTKGQLTALLEQREPVLVNTRDGMRDGITKPREELSSLTSNPSSIEKSLREAEKNAAKLTDDVEQLWSQLQDLDPFYEDTQREALIGLSSEMQETVKKQVEEIKKIEGGLAELRKSYEIVIEQLRLEMERTKDKDDKLSDAVERLQRANSTLEEREKALSVALEDSER